MLIEDAKKLFFSLSDEQKFQLLCTIKEDNERLREDRERLAKLLAEAVELKKLRTAEKYVPKSEIMANLFPELEIIAQPFEDSDQKQAGPEPDAVEKPKKKEHKQKTKAPADTPVCNIDHTADAPASFVKEGVVYVRSGEEVVTKLTRIPAKVVVEKHIYPAYESTSEAERGKNRIVLMNNKEVEGLGCSPALVANVVVNKYDDHLPLYRQEEIFQRQGLYLSRQKLASWVLKYAQMLAPLEKRFKRIIYSSNFLNKDETPIEVLDFRTDKGEISKTSWMYITVGTTYSEDERRRHSLVLAEYIQSRGEEQLLEDYRAFGYSGYVLTDGLGGYSKIEKTKHAICWVHAVRPFKNILKENRKEKNAKHICDLAGKLYTIEDRFRTMLEDGSIGVDEFLSLRKAEAEPVIDAIYTFADEIEGKYSPTGAMGRGLNYLKTFKEHMKVYLECVEARPDNNVAERIAKPFATGRKNWLFAQSIDGADASALLFSLIETAKISGLNSEDYLEFVFTFAPECRSEEDWDALLPWNADLGRLKPIRAARTAAVPDSKRKEDYLFTGLTGQHVLNF